MELCFGGSGSQYMYVCMCNVCVMCICFPSVDTAGGLYQSHYAEVALGSKLS